MGFKGIHTSTRVYAVQAPAMGVNCIDLPHLGVHSNVIHPRPTLHPKSTTDMGLAANVTRDTLCTNPVVLHLPYWGVLPQAIVQAYTTPLSRRDGEWWAAVQYYKTN
jgi:hypothetical protein